MRRVLLATSLAGLLFTLAPASVHASPQSVIRDCTDNGRIDNAHSQGDYKGALKKLPSDVDEYTDCRATIRAAQQRDASGGSTGGSGSTDGSFGGTGFSTGSFGGTGFSVPPGGTPIAPATTAETDALGATIGAGGLPVPIAGEPITPGASGLAKNAGDHSLPGSLLVVLLLAGLAALAGGLGGRRHDLPPGQGVIGRVFPRRA